MAALVSLRSTAAVSPPASAPAAHDRVQEATLQRWFAAEVLPLDGALSRMLHRACTDRADAEDLKQEVYARVFERARQARPLFTRAFVFSTTRNLLIDRARRRKIVVIDYVAEIDRLQRLVDRIEPERILLGRERLDHLQAAIETLPPRCREVVVLRKIAGVSQRDVAIRMGITEDTVERQVMTGMRRLVDALSAGQA